MSRGGIGKSKKKPPPPKRGSQARGPRARGGRGRVEVKRRPGLAAGLGGTMIGLSTFVLFAGLVLISDEQEGGQTALSLGLATLPLGFATVAVLSQQVPIIRNALLGYLVAVASASVVLLGTGIFGFGAFFTSVTVGVGLGGLFALRRPGESSNRIRLGGVAIVGGIVLAAELLGVVVVALIGPFVVISALHFADSRALLKAAAEG